jgi:murein DD-endopeptidase MepM/ murein hydrolase activator NlpD
MAVTAEPVRSPGLVVPPAWVARKVVPDAVDVVAGSHTVKSGESLRSVAARTGAGVEAIARANGLSRPFTIREGQTLRIPAGRFHTVKSGETGIAIARAYGVEWNRVIALNELTDPYVLRSGQRLLIPSKVEVAEMTPAQRAAAFRIDIGDLISGGEPAPAANKAPARPVRTATRTLPPTTAVAEPKAFSGRFDWPLRGRLLKRFGPGGSGRRNDGINIAATAGAPIMAASDGVVVYVGSEIAVFGGLILVRHGGGWTTAYGHAQDLLVKRGQAVKRGEIIGRAGETGSADSPQLHFEIRKGRLPVDPIQYLPRA